jgi:hypothetical protein
MEPNFCKDDDSIHDVVHANIEGRIDPNKILGWFPDVAATAAWLIFTHTILTIFRPAAACMLRCDKARGEATESLQQPMLPLETQQPP